MLLSHALSPAQEPLRRKGISGQCRWQCPLGSLPCDTCLASELVPAAAGKCCPQTAAPQTMGLMVLPLGGCDWAEACQQQCGFILTKELKKGNGFSLCQRFIHICLTQTVSPRPSHHFSEPQADF